MDVKLEYIWLDGYETPNLRSKTKIVEWEEGIFTKDYFLTKYTWDSWSFDGSSTQQADGDNSDCVLHPFKAIVDPQRTNGYLLLCEVLNADGTPHKSNIRAKIENNNEDLWFGFEQEYTLIKDGRPLGFPTDGYPKPQGEFYCAVGNENIEGRRIVEEHLNACLDAGLKITGINAEVMLGQWEYQLFGHGQINASDDLWLSRYLLHRITEKYNIGVEFHPKPIGGDWNGSGCHTNFSTKEMRDKGGEKMIKGICDTFSFYHKEHIQEYGYYNNLRLTGKHETQHINDFSYGVSDRGASIRIPIGVVKDNWKGYLEDRRPASNMDPYRVTKIISKTLDMAISKLNGDT
tara:strand:- start:4843 stop:5883 length:1041 start_codon:yes stop_codon:yes gene_type:complete